MIDALRAACRRLGARLQEYRDIDYGRQFFAVRAGERVLVTVYSGRRGAKVHIDANQVGPLAAELRAEFSPKKPPSMWETWAGSDESGKGDFFGPLCVAAVRVTRELAAGLTRAGVRDSKDLEDERILEMDGAIRRACAVGVASLPPEEYNAAYDGNLNRLLGRLHAEALAKVAEGAEALVVDKFGHERYVREPLRKLGVETKLVMRVRAESDPAVAAASVVARAEFVRALRGLEERFGMPLPPGASVQVEAAARAFARRHDREALARVAKRHFRTWSRV
jgi:ribonuclease HIII